MAVSFFLYIYMMIVFKDSFQGLDRDFRPLGGVKCPGRK